MSSFNAMESELVEYSDYTKQETVDILRLMQDIERMQMFSNFMRQYSKDFNAKIYKIHQSIDSEFDDLIQQFNARRNELKSHLSDLQQTKQHQIEGEIQSLSKYSQILKQKAANCTNAMIEAKEKQFDATHRESDVHRIIDEEVDPTFELYQDPFLIVSHFQSVVTRPVVVFDENQWTDSRSETRNMVNVHHEEKGHDLIDHDHVSLGMAIRRHGAVSEEPMKEFTNFLRDFQSVPQEMKSLQQLQRLIKGKMQTAESVFTASRHNVTKLRMKDLNELNALTVGTVSMEIVMVFEALYFMVNGHDDDGSEWMRFIYSSFLETKKRRERWNEYREMLMEPTFVPNLFNFEAEQLRSKQLMILENNYKFRYRVIQKESECAAQLAHFIKSLCRYRSYQKQYQSVRRTLKEQRKELNQQSARKLQHLQRKQAELVNQSG